MGITEIKFLSWPPPPIGSSEMMRQFRNPKVNQLVQVAGQAVQDIVCLCFSFRVEFLLPEANPPIFTAIVGSVKTGIGCLHSHRFFLNRKNMPVPTRIMTPQIR